VHGTFSLNLMPGFSGFLDEFKKLRKTTISLIMSVRPSIRMEQISFHWKDFYEILYLSIFADLSRKFKFH